MAAGYGWAPRRKGARNRERPFQSAPAHYQTQGAPQHPQGPGQRRAGTRAFRGLARPQNHRARTRRPTASGDKRHLHHPSAALGWSAKRRAPARRCAPARRLAPDPLAQRIPTRIAVHRHPDASTRGCPAADREEHRQVAHARQLVRPDGNTSPDHGDSEPAGLRDFQRREGALRAPRRLVRPPAQADRSRQRCPPHHRSRQATP